MKTPQALLPIAPLLLTAATAAAGGPQYTADGAFVVPSDYREWVFLSAGLDMSYSEAPQKLDHSMFDNVFVDRASWERFKATGHWPDKTMLVMEARKASTRGSINKHGKFQSEERMAIEVHVHDEARFKGGWAFFVGNGETPAQLVPYAAECYSCHLKHGAVDTTFTQFYPTAKPIAMKAGSFHGE